MSNRYPGGFITLDEPTVNSTSAKGVWTLDQQADYQGQGVWPTSMYQISRSLRFNSADSAYLSRTPASAGNRRTWTWSGWVKFSATGTQQIFVAGSDSSNRTYFVLDAVANAELTFYTDLGGSSITTLTTTQAFRDPSAWYHIVYAVDTTQATASNRIKLYVNGVQVTAFGTATYQNQNTDTFVNAVNAHYIGNRGFTNEQFLNGYLADINFIDGQALTPSSFGETDATTGVWKPIAYAGTYGTNGFHLDFSDNSNTTAATLGADSSGNGNNWTPSGSPGFSVAAGAGNDSLVDSPTQYGTGTSGGDVRGNYATWNPLWLAGTFTNGNLDATTASGDSAVGTTFGMSSGKWYAEMLITRTAPTTAGAAYITVGLIPSNMPAGTTNGYTATSYGYYSQTGNKVNNSSSSAYGASYDVNDVIGIAFDADAGTLTFYKNGASQGTAFSSIPAGTYFFAIGEGDASNTASATLNAGQRPFAYTAPSGFKALCTTNLPDPTVLQGDDHFNTVLYTGTGNDPLAITGVGFQPDMVWIKSRSNALAHNIYDAVRGVSKRIQTNLTNAESSPISGVKSFDTDGFTLGNDTDDTNFTNGNTYVAWNWKANGAGSLNEVGSIPSTVSANTTAGISIVTYTGTGANATVGHGLGVAPRMLIIKRRDSTGTWRVGHSSLTSWAYRLNLNETAAEAINTGAFNSTAPTSTVFSIGTEDAVNASAGTYVALCFAPISGYSAISAYTGNGSTDGPFVYTGFRPAFVMIKRTDSADRWVMSDNKRGPYNFIDEFLDAQDSIAEGNFGITGGIDYLSNGFKVRDADTAVNASGGTYIYMAFSQNPFKTSLAR